MDNHKEKLMPEGSDGDYIELLFRGFSPMRTADVVMMVLTNRDASRYLPVLVDKLSKAQLLLRTDDNDYCAQRLPEVLCAVCPDMDADHYLLYIEGVVQQGVYAVSLVCRKTHERFQLCISDAVLLAQVAHLPLLIPRTLFDDQSAPFTLEQLAKPYLAPLTRIALEAFDMGTLCEMLNQAVAEEKFEEAQRIKEELDRRTGKTV